MSQSEAISTPGRKVGVIEAVMKGVFVGLAANVVGAGLVLGELVMYEVVGVMLSRGPAHLGESSIGLGYLSMAVIAGCLVSLVPAGLAGAVHALVVRISVLSADQAFCRRSRHVGTFIGGAYAIALGTALGITSDTPMDRAGMREFALFLLCCLLPTGLVVGRLAGNTIGRWLVRHR